MRYYKTISDGYITAIGTGGGGTEITGREYDQIMSVIQSKPPRTDTTDYHLREDLTWEAYERPADPTLAPDAPDDLEQAAQYLLGQNFVEIPAEEEPDYLNENEPEPDYFA